MAKIVIVKNITKCGECPYLYQSRSYVGEDDLMCLRDERLRYSEDAESIPDWCPLPEDKTND